MTRLCPCGCGVDLDAMSARIEALLVERMPMPEHLRPVGRTLDRVESKLGAGLLGIAARFVGRRSR